MSVNRSLPHLLVLPEDDAIRQIANGFALNVNPFVPLKNLRVLAEAGGWRVVIERFQKDHIKSMREWPNCSMVLLIDFDHDRNRLSNVTKKIPDDLQERVFVLGVWSKPEELKKKLERSYEDIGLTLAEECRTNTDRTWNHDLLRHNADELKRLRQQVNPILFPLRAS